MPTSCDSGRVIERALSQAIAEAMMIKPIDAASMRISFRVASSLTAFAA